MLPSFMAPLTTFRRVSSREIPTPPELSGCTERTVEYTSSVGEVTELRSAPVPAGAVVLIRRAAKNPMGMSARAPIGWRSRGKPLNEAPDAPLKVVAKASRNSRHGPFHGAPNRGAPPRD